MAKLKSVIAKDLSRSYLSGRRVGIEVHHIFGGFNRDRSTKYGYVVGLHFTEHPNGSWARVNWASECERLTEIDLKLKQIAQMHYEENHGTRQDFIEEFGRSYL